MKKIAYLTLLLGTAVWTGLQAQTNAPVDDAAPTNAPAAPPAVTVDVASTNVTVTASTNVTVTVSVDTNAAAAAATTVTVDAASATNAPASNIPVIRFTDVPLTTAIENLALAANINYLLDPKIGYGQPDASGQIKVEPQLSIRWENISAENALIALLDNYGLQMTRDKNTGIGRISLKDPTAPPPLITRVVQLQYASVTNMTEAVQSVLTDKRSKVLADTRSSQIVVVATDPEQSAVDTLIKELDTPTKQVLIETKLVEVSSQPSTTKGVNWSSTLSAQNVSFGNGKIVPSTSQTTVNTGGAATIGTGTPGGGYTSTTSAGGSSSTLLNLIQGSGGFAASTAKGLVPYTAFLNADGLNAVISFINNTYDAQIMSTPRIVTLDNETARIDVTRQYPVINLSGGTQNTSGSLGISYSNVGTTLEVTPRISANQKIWLRVIPEVSSHFADVTVTVPGGNGNPSTSFPVPIFDGRKLTTQVLIPNGNTLVMGGLVQDNPTATYNKVPILGDIPGIGWGFRSEDKTMDKDNLIIFLTPTIIQDSDFAATPEAEDFLKSKPQPMKTRMDPHTWWDSGEARGDWSNPAPVPGEFDGQPAMHNF
ncbi:MAG TPA: secretin N-terminal domain-containing protein [Candidatus Sulfotelmatobacter sp.]|jgi:type II secretory pathway component GspD/PulD (secretin)|nr:secretin N-terminal domain-containing protein [Candidatus Sulfotelmatobacter sp.]